MLGALQCSDIKHGYKKHECCNQPGSSAPEFVVELLYTSNEDLLEGPVMVGKDLYFTQFSNDRIHNKLLKLDTMTGNISNVVSDAYSINGLAYHEKTNTLYGANWHPESGGILKYDLTSKKLTQLVDAPEYKYMNDLVLADDNTLYVSNTEYGGIWKYDILENTLEPFIEDLIVNDREYGGAKFTDNWITLSQESVTGDLPSLLYFNFKNGVLYQGSSLTQTDVCIEIEPGTYETEIPFSFPISGLVLSKAKYTLNDKNDITAGGVSSFLVFESTLDFLPAGSYTPAAPFKYVGVTNTTNIKHVTNGIGLHNNMLYYAVTFNTNKLQKYDLNTREFSSVNGPITPDGFDANKDGYIYIGTQKGLAIMDSTGHILTHIPLGVCDKCGDDAPIFVTNVLRSGEHIYVTTLDGKLFDIKVGSLCFWI